MNYRILGVFLIGMVCASGCIFVVGGAVGALGGYAISQDTIEGESDITYHSLWNSAVDVMGVMGTQQVINSQEATIVAQVDSAKVWITFERLAQATTRIRVKARRYLMPHITLSQKIFVKIIERAH